MWTWPFIPPPTNHIRGDSSLVVVARNWSEWFCMSIKEHVFFLITPHKPDPQIDICGIYPPPSFWEIISNDCATFPLLHVQACPSSAQKYFNVWSNIFLFLQNQIYLLRCVISLQLNHPVWPFVSPFSIKSIYFILFGVWTCLLSSIQSSVCFLLGGLSIANTHHMAFILRLALLFFAQTCPFFSATVCWK